MIVKFETDDTLFTAEIRSKDADSVIEFKEMVGKMLERTLHVEETKFKIPALAPTLEGMTWCEEHQRPDYCYEAIGG